MAAPQGKNSVAACWTSLPPAPALAEALASAKWSCRRRISHLTGERIAVRFPPATETGAPIRHFRAGLGSFDRITLVGEDADGTLLTSAHSFDSVQPLSGQPLFALPFPQPAEAAAFYAVIERPRTGHILHAIGATANPPGSERGERLAVTALALLLGMLLVPPLLDVAVFRVLRRGVFLQHALVTLCVAGLLFVWSGLVFEIVDLSMAGWYRLLMVMLGLCGVSACLFKRSFALASRTNRRVPVALAAGAIYAAVMTALFAAGALDTLLPTGTFGYTLLPVLLLLGTVMGIEFRKGTGTARMQVAGWAPLLLFFAVQMIADLFSYRLPADGLVFLGMGVFIETVMSTIAISLLFLAIRRERDVAQARAQVMGNLAERDHLTGLLNRRAIDTRFTGLRSCGYDTLALIDIDHFKAINDVSGHSVGDQVLEITARVLASDPDNIAVRMGGEEFLLLLRGEDAAARAEKLRRMLSVRVAREVDGLEQIVTASMGLLVLPSDAHEPLSFSSAYSRADLLLYQAKREGRNRTVTAVWRLLDQRQDGYGELPEQDGTAPAAAA
ncbi:GGDEF domain-containing protein [Qipengyuania thermophila]|uniref:GGDEF domain-containing protein n=1 Tax=Qipengyuania thermophila TaxID=2509361 RepID=UPI0013ED1EFD|nr:GGDEF domain-containing protein [Qipengyuania thermophila]